MDPTLHAQLRLTLVQGQPPDGIDEATRAHLQRLRPHFAVHNHVLFYTPPNHTRPRRVVPRGEMLETLRQTHDYAGHFAEDNTLERTRRSFYWPGMKNDIRAYVRGCLACQNFRLAVRTEPLHPIPVHEPFHTLSLDCIGPLPDSHGARYILIAVDHLTKWIETVALHQLSAQTTATFLYEQIICRHGCPTRIITDNGSEFTGQMVGLLAHRMDVRHHRIIAYRPQGNGHVERVNRTIVGILRRAMFENDSDAYRADWREFLPSATFAYNTMRHSMTGHTPFYLLYGHEPRLPQDLPRRPPTEDIDDYDPAVALNQRAQDLQRLREATNVVRDALTQQQTQYAARYNARRQHITAREVIQPGNLVLVQRQLGNTAERKFRPQWIGPYRVLSLGKQGEVYLCQRSGLLARRPVHRDQITRFYEQDEGLPA